MNIEYSDSISGKVFTKDDVLRLIELCSKNIAKRKKEDVYNSEYFDVSLRSKDRLSYQFNAYDAKEIEPVLETKKTVQVSITFRN